VQEDTIILARDVGHNGKQSNSSDVVASISIVAHGFVSIFGIFCIMIK
jgi:hypothetical protein